MSVYNGRGYNGFAADDSLFRFRPASDGLSAITSLGYQGNGSSYYLGGGLYYNSFHMRGAETEKSSPDGIMWGYVERRLTKTLYLLAQYSAAFSSDVWCHMFGGVGAVMQFRTAEIGFFSDCAVFSGEKEYASEFTCRITFSDRIFLQPAVHLIQGTCGFRIAALMRLNISI